MAGRHTTWKSYRNQRTACRNQLPPSTMWSSRKKFRQSTLAIRVFTCFLLFKTIDPNPTVSLSWSKLKQKSSFFFFHEWNWGKKGRRKKRRQNVIQEHHLPLTYVLWAFALSYTCWVMIESAFFSLGRKAKKEESKAKQNYTVTCYC